MEEREQTAAGDIGTARAERARGGNSGAAESFEDERLVPLGRAEQDGDPVEGDALFGSGVDGARDLHAFERFAGGGEDDYAAIVVANWNGVTREEVALERFERGCGSRGVRCEAEIEREACRAHRGGEQLALEEAARGDIERDDGGLAQGVVGGGKCVAGESDAGGVVGETAVGEFAGVGVEEVCEVGAGVAAGTQTVGLDGVETELFEGGGEGARKAGEGGDGTQVGELAAFERTGGDARGEGFAHESADGNERAAIELGGGEIEDEFAEGEAADVHEGGGASFERDFVGGGAHGREDEDGTSGGEARDEVDGTAAELGVRTGHQPPIGFASAGTIWPGSSTATSGPVGK